MNPYLELHREARTSNDPLAISAATLARDLYACGGKANERMAVSHAKIAYARLAELAPVTDLELVAARCAAFAELAPVTDLELAAAHYAAGWLIMVAEGR